MATRQYDTDELFTETELDAVLWLAVAQRHAQRHCKEAFLELVSLRRALEQEAVRLARQLDDPSDTHLVEQAYPDLVFDRAQYGNGGPLRYWPDDAVLPFVVATSERTLQHIQTVEEHLTCSSGFTLADFSGEDDIGLLRHWWIDVITDTRQAKGKFKASLPLRGPNGKYEGWSSYLMPARRLVKVVPAGTVDKPFENTGDLMASVHRWLTARRKESRPKQLFRRYDGVNRKMLALLSIAAHEAGAASQAAAIAQVLEDTNEEVSPENVRMEIQRLSKLTGDLPLASAEQVLMCPCSSNRTARLVLAPTSPAAAPSPA
jgi:hypothetical protein